MIVGKSGEIIHRNGEKLIKNKNHRKSSEITKNTQKEENI